MALPPQMMLLYRQWEGAVGDRKIKRFFNVLPYVLQNKSTSTPTSPGPRTHSTPSIPVLTAGQSGLYSPQYISYIPQIHMGPAVQVREETRWPRVRGLVGMVEGTDQACSGHLSANHSASSVFLSLGTSDVSISCIQLSAWTAGQVPGSKR